MKCPGQDTQYWNGDAIFETQCPECGHPMEFFKDDATRRCAHCKKKIVNPRMDFGCAAYCKFAEQCLGTLPEEFVAKRDDLLKDRVAVEMKRHFGTDFKRIGHAAKVANFAEKIGKKERANLAVVLCAAYLYDIGIKNAQEKYNSVAPEFMEKESVTVARELMVKLGAKDALINDVIELVGHRSQVTKADSVNRKILHDADMLTHMAACEKKTSVNDRDFIAKLDRLFLTEAGNELAKQVLIEMN
ncbi:HD domain-containing protein [Desulfobacula sp.]|uniref:HD domain-containing protein n=1 Tax=Desulfobacula sp. TaxID=2593537 RepID=UPI0026250A37|nr:HD domain-containing protein [Desulfobacula sp.]